MSEPKFTPGPWRFTNGQVPRVMAGPTAGVCGVHKIGSQTGQFDATTHAANGHLLAAAPDLYAQLEDAKATLEEAAKLLVDRHPSVANNIVNQCAVRCGDLLAKARGE